MDLFYENRFLPERNKKDIRKNATLEKKTHTYK